MNPFGTIQLPSALSNLGDVDTGLSTLLNIIFGILIIIAGIYAVFNFIIAGYLFISAGGDPKKVADAWAKIWQSILGLVVSAGAFVIAAIISQLIFGDPSTLLNPILPTP